MKNLFVLFAALAITLGASAQAKTASKDGLMMKDGKMWIMKAGTNTEMKNEMTMKNGTKVTPAGAWTSKDGKKGMMKNGDSMDMEGNMMMGSAPGKK